MRERECETLHVSGSGKDALSLKSPDFVRPFTVLIADKVFRIESRYPEVKQLCGDYLVESAEAGELLPEAVFQISEEDIREERRRSVQEAAYERLPVPLFTAGRLEITAVLRKLAEYLSRNGGAVMHGVLLEHQNHGILFTAPSGTGKSTHAENWRRVFSDCRIINGDKPVIGFRDKRIVGYGTPWAGKEGIQINASVPLDAVVFLHRADINHIEEIPFRKALPQLIGCIYRGTDSDGVKRAALTASGFRDRVRFYSLGCNRNEDSARVAYEGIFKYAEADDRK